MTSEIRMLVEHMEVRREEKAAGVHVWEGKLFGQRCVVARSGMGKVAAASCAQRLIGRYRASPLVVCGLAGALHEELRVGDVVVGRAYIQHDVDASPIFPRFELPGLGLKELLAPEDLVQKAVDAARAFVGRGLRTTVDPAALAEFGIESPRVATGLIATGDQFITQERRAELRASMPEAACVEMEGASIAQVCHLNDTPFVIIRTISDQADASAGVDFERFVGSVAPAYTLGIVRELFARL